MNQLCSTFPDHCVLPFKTSQWGTTNGEFVQALNHGKYTTGRTICSTGDGTKGGHSSAEPHIHLFRSDHWETFSILCLSQPPHPISFLAPTSPFSFLCHSDSHSSSLCVWFCFALNFPSFTIKLDVFHQLWTPLITVSLQLQC